MARAALRFLVLVLLIPGTVRAQETAKKGPSIPPEEFASRRARLLKDFEGALIFMEADPLGKGMDSIDSNTPKYDFFYLTGYHHPGDFLVVGPKAKSEILFTGEPTEDVKAKSGIADVRPLEKFDPFLEDLKGKAGRIVTRLREEAKGKVVDAGERAGIKVESEGKKIRETITKLRMIKSPAELDMMRKAADATNRAQIDAMKACKPGLNEKDLQTLIEDKFKSEGCDGLSFPSIVGSGKNGTILHYNDNTEEIPKDTLIVCDIGAAYRGYVTDITRTIPTEGKFSGLQKVAYQGVLDAQKAAEKLLKPGATFRELHEAAADVLKDRKLTDWSFAHSKNNSVRHGLCHYVGLAVHDSGIYNVKFEPGMVITIEPGYYNKDEGFGIRIEDIYIITHGGFERMSAGAPREIAEIEKLMAKKKEH